MGRTEPLSVLLMADEKTGKTVATGYGVGYIATFAGLPEGLLPLTTVVGLSNPRIERALYVQDYLAVIDKVANTYKSKAGERPIVVADDFGLAMARTESKLRETPNINLWQLFGALSAQVAKLYTHAAARSVGLILSTHVTAPRAPTKENPTYEQGRARMPTKELAAMVGREPSTILWQTRTPGNPPAGSEFVCGSGVPVIPGTTVPAYITGDRHNIAPPRMYPALGELLRMQGYTIPRPPEVERLEEAFRARAAAAGAGAEPTDKVVEGVATKTQLIQFLLNDTHSAPEWAVAWLIGDLLGRVDLRRHHQSLRGAARFAGVNFG